MLEELSLQKFIAYLASLSKVPAVRGSLALYSGNLIAAALGFMVSLIVARKLGPSSYALIAAYNAVIVTLIGLTDFGLGVGLIKNVGPLLQNKPHEARPFFALVFWFEVFSGLLVLIFGLSLSPLISSLAGADAKLEVVQLAIISAAFASAGAFAGISLLAHKMMLTNSILATAMSLVRLLAIVLLWYFSALTVVNILVCFVSISILNFIAGLVLIPKNFWGRLPISKIKPTFIRIFKISGWLTLSSLLAAIMSRLDFFYLFKIKGSTEAGYYGAAIQLSMVFAILISSISAALTPYISEKTTHEGRVKFLKKALVAVGLGALVIGIIIILAPVVISLLFGSKYIQAVPAFRILGFHFILNLILIPITLLFIPLGKMHIGTAVSVLQLCAAIILYPILITNFGSAGAATTMLVTTLIGFVAYSLVLMILLRTK